MDSSLRANLSDLVTVSASPSRRRQRLRGAGLMDACGKSRSQEEASPSVPLKASWGRLGPYGEVYLAAGEFGLNAGRRPERPSGSDFS